jgi:signal transduction histidine kinase
MSYHHESTEPSPAAPGWKDLSIPQDLLDCWQTIVNLLQDCSQTTSSIITRIDYPNIRIVRASENPGNPYFAGMSDGIANHYCEEVMNTSACLVVPNALESDRWRNAPEIEHGVISYLGYPLFWPDGELFGTICLLDTKENAYDAGIQQMVERFRKVVEYNLQAVYDAERLRRTSKAKDKLLSVISHDLRSPLISLLNLCRYGMEGFERLSREELEEYFHSLFLSTKSVLHLVDNLLQWSRDQLEGRSPSPEPLNLSELIDQSIGLLSENAAYKSVDLRTDVEPELRMEGDRTMIRSVLQNLLTNAIKFSPRGGEVTIEASASGPWITVTVADQGEGLSQEEVESLLDADTHFSRVGTAGERGAGLGVLLCKQFVEYHGGDLDIRSLPHKGTSVTVRLPRASSPRAPYKPQ